MNGQTRTQHGKWIFIWQPKIPSSRGSFQRCTLNIAWHLWPLLGQVSYKLQLDKIIEQPASGHYQQSLAAGSCLDISPWQTKSLQEYEWRRANGMQTHTHMLIESNDHPSLDGWGGGRRTGAAQTLSRLVCSLDRTMFSTSRLFTGLSHSLILSWHRNEQSMLKRLSRPHLLSFPPFTPHSLSFSSFPFILLISLL